MNRKINRIIVAGMLVVFVTACATEEKKEEKGAEVHSSPSVSSTPDTVQQVPQEIPATPQGGPHAALHGHAHENVEPNKVTPPSDPFKGASFKAEVFYTDNVGWGYDLYIDGKKTIHQPHIPGVSGLKGFDTKEKANKAADFVLYKLKNNIMPPSVSKSELDSLGVL